MSSNVLAMEPARTFHHGSKPDRAEVEAAVRTIIRWSGDNPDREGLVETPARVTRALEEAFVGYAHDPAAILQKSFDEIEGYDEMIVLRGIRFSNSSHHRPGCQYYESQHATRRFDQYLRVDALSSVMSPLHDRSRSLPKPYLWSFPHASLFATCLNFAISAKQPGTKGPYGPWNTIHLWRSYAGLPSPLSSMAAWEGCRR